MSKDSQNSNIELSREFISCAKALKIQIRQNPLSFHGWASASNRHEIFRSLILNFAALEKTENKKDLAFFLSDDDFQINSRNLAAYMAGNRAPTFQNMPAFLDALIRRTETRISDLEVRLD